MPTCCAGACIFNEGAERGWLGFNQGFDVKWYFSSLSTSLVSVNLAVCRLPFEQLIGLHNLPRLKSLEIHNVANLPAYANIYAPQLEKPHLSNAGNTADSFYVDCENLKHLMLKSFKIACQPPGVMICCGLTVLHLARCSWNDHGIEWVCTMTNLRDLRLRHCAVESLPPAIYDLTELGVLCIEYCGLAHVPSALPQSLRHVRLCGTSFRDIPAVLEALSHLRSLKISSQSREEQTCLQIKRPLMPFLSMPHLQHLKLVDTQPASEIYPWDFESVKHLLVAHKYVINKKLGRKQHVHLHDGWNVLNVFEV